MISPSHNNEIYLHTKVWCKSFLRVSFPSQVFSIAIAPEEHRSLSFQLNEKFISLVVTSEFVFCFISKIVHKNIWDHSSVLLKYGNKASLSYFKMVPEMPRWHHLGL